MKTFINHYYKDEDATFILFVCLFVFFEVLTGHLVLFLQNDSDRPLNFQGPSKIS